MTTEERKEWLRARQHCITGTDIPSICGVGFDDEEGPARVYAEKVADEPIDTEPTERMRAGLALEEYTSKRFSEITGIQVFKPRENFGLVRHPSIEWQAATVDYLCVHEPADVEVKCLFSGYSFDEWGDTGSDRVPDKVLLQKLWQLHVQQFQYGYVAANFVGNQIRWYKPKGDEELAGMLVRIADEFWDRVIHRRGVDGWRMPLIDKVCQSVQRIDESKTIFLGKDVSEMRIRYALLADQIKEAEKEKDKIKDEVKKQMGDASEGILPDGWKVRQKIINRSEYVVNETTYLDCRFLRQKKG